MIGAAAFCPHPPVLVPRLAAGGAPELDKLRAACTAAVTRLGGPDRPLWVVGAGPADAAYGPDVRGSLAGFGVDDVPGELPLSLTIGTWLAREAGRAPAGAIAIGPGAVTPRLDDAVDVLVMGDASARRSTAAPGYLDDRAAGYDTAVAQAFASGAPARLAALDPGLGADLLAAGAPVWAALAPAFGRIGYDAELLYEDAPYGVGYLVAAWT